MRRGCTRAAPTALMVLSEFVNVAGVASWVLSNMTLGLSGQVAGDAWVVSKLVVVDVVEVTRARRTLLSWRVI